ncbi:CFDP2 protein, partial [Polypterus senegalus]
MITIDQRSVTYQVVSMPGDGTYLFHSLCYILHGHIRLTLDIQRKILSYVLNDWDRFKVWTDDGTGDNYTTQEHYKSEMLKPFTYGSASADLHILTLLEHVKHQLSQLAVMISSLSGRLNIECSPDMPEEVQFPLQSLEEVDDFEAWLKQPTNALKKKNTGGLPHRLRTTAVADWLLPMVSDVTPFNERIMRLGLLHSLGALSVVSVYAPTAVSDVSARETFYSQLRSVVDGCPGGDIPLVMGDFNATTATDRAGYEDCLGPHRSGDRGEGGTMFLDFAKGQELRIAGSWFQHPEPHRWTWYSNSGGVVKEIDHILMGRCWRLLQNCRVYRSAQFVNSEHRLVVATLRIQLRYSRLQPARKMSLDLARLQEHAVCNEFACSLCEELSDLGMTADPNVMWETFRDKTLKGC